MFLEILLFIFAHTWKINNLTIATFFPQQICVFLLDIWMDFFFSEVDYFVSNCFQANFSSAESWDDLPFLKFSISIDESTKPFHKRIMNNSCLLVNVFMVFLEQRKDYLQTNKDLTTSIHLLGAAKAPHNDLITFCW